MRARAPDLAHHAADVLERLRARHPRVHCITNGVAQALSANMLLAVGAVPSMTVTPEEVGDFVSTADALLVNLGTMDSDRRAAFGLAVDTATEHEIPWVLDPTFIDRSLRRAEFARALVALHPRAIRLNRQEFTTLSGTEPSAEALAAYARQSRAAIGLTGERDLVVDGVRSATLANGHPLMAKITAMGCAGSALVAACHAVEKDPWSATTAGLILVGVAGEIAAERARGPGSLVIEIIDALEALDSATVRARARVS